MAEDQIAKKIETGGTSEQPTITQPETEISPEQSAEQKIERVAPKAETIKVAETPVAPVARKAVVTKTAQQLRDEQIDAILSDGLTDIYLSLSPKKQAEFRVGGEETVKKISGLLSQTKVKIKQIVDIIKRWLSIIPGINKFFLEQDAKIKAEKIIKLKN
jgi:fatty acid/phospholipid biosynthesis enzyme